MKLRYRYVLGAIGFLATLPILLWATPAAAWYAPLNTAETYYMPGPPPGPYLSGCMTTTANGNAFGLAFTQMRLYYNAYSNCAGGYTWVVYDYNGSLYSGPSAPLLGTSANQSTATLEGSSVVAGVFGACNDSYPAEYCVKWETSPLT